MIVSLRKVQIRTRMDFRYFEGRYFINPLIGCKGKCIYCYLNEQIENKNFVRTNTNSIVDTLEKISNDSNFISGVGGSIISIGSYCDIFPLQDIQLCLHSVEWIIECLKFGNPVQVISKNSISDEIIEKIATSVSYRNQLLYSTTITTFKHQNIIEKNTSSPVERLSVLKKFHDFDVKTNVMIKPFIFGMTDLEMDLFITLLSKYKVWCCVIGDYYLVNNGLQKIIDGSREGDKDNMIETILDCSVYKSYKTIRIKNDNKFLLGLKSSGINTFLKSSCANSNILNIPNKAHTYNLENGFCVQCGLCI